MVEENALFWMEKPLRKASSAPTLIFLIEKKGGRKEAGRNYFLSLKKPRRKEKNDNEKDLLMRVRSQIIDIRA